MVIGTTGFSPDEQAVIQQAGKEIPIVLSPNMSLGVNLCFNALEGFSVAMGGRKMDKESEAAIIDIHQRHKKDAPSGTALQMAALLNHPNVQFSSLRMGDALGEHRVLLMLEGETIELTHRTLSRSVYGEGAVRAAKWLMSQPAGIYGMKEVFSERAIL